MVFYVLLAPNRDIKIMSHEHTYCAIAGYAHKNKHKQTGAPSRKEREREEK